MSKYKITFIFNSKENIKAVKNISKVYGGVVKEECEIEEEFKTGDTIECVDADEAIKLMNELEDRDIITDFLYEKEGKKGLWLEVK